MKKEWTVYMIECKSGALYTGITNDIEKRFLAHQKGSGAKFFRIHLPKKIVYKEKACNRSHASKRESEIKKLTRAKKLELINKNR